MKELLNLRGIITVLNTPFTDDLAIDLESLQKNIKYAINSGVAGFLVPAMASEVEKLTAEERCIMVQKTLEETNHQVPVIGGASATNPEDRIQYATQLIELGCEGILVSIPFQDEEQYIADVQAIADLSPPFLMLQDWSSSGYGVPVKIIQQLFETIPCFRALKIEVVPAGVKYSEVLAVTGGKLNVSGGWAVSQMIEGLDRGIHAFMPTGMHEIYCEIYNRYANGDRIGAQKLFNRLLPVLAFSNQHLDISIHFYKRILWKQGIYSTPNVRPPILPFDQIHEILADELIALVQQLTTEIQNH